MSVSLKNFTIDDNVTLKEFTIEHTVKSQAYSNNSRKTTLKIYYGSGNKLNILEDAVEFLKKYDKNISY